MDPVHEFDGATLTVPLTDDLLPGAVNDTDIDARIEGLLAATQARRLLLDMAAVRNLRSMGIAALIQVHTACRSRGVPLALCGLDPDVARVFRATALTRVFPVYASANEARAASGWETGSDGG